MASRILRLITSPLWQVLLISQVWAQSFDFNSGTTQGWTLDQMYETSTQNKITPFTSFSLSNQQNQLAASVSPLLIGDPSIQSYDIYLESPDLSSNANWQNIAGYSIDLQRTLDSQCGHPPNVYFAQLQLKVIDTADNNKEKLFAEHNGSNFVFHDIVFGQSYHFVWKPSFLTDPKYKVKNIRIRLTGPGDPGPGGGECAPKGSWLLDNVNAEGSVSTASLTVDVPNGGEVWEANTPHFIVWHSQNFTDPVKIEYSTDGGGSYSTIVATTPNDGSYEWTVPNSPSTQCLVRISDASSGSPSDVSDANFTITATEAIFVDVPNGGESWEAGTPHYIVWHNHLYSDPVKIEYSTDGGSSYTTITASTANTGSYQWNVPNTPSTQCRVRISDASDGNPSDVSDSNFSITANEAITVDVPNGGEDWEVGSPRFIVWHNHLFGDPVKIEYSTDGGGSYSTISPSAPNSGSYQWTIPNTPSSNCLVRISDASDGNPSDESDASFTISSTAQTNTPPGSNIQVPLGSGVEVTFDNVINGGTTALEVKTSGTLPPEGLAVVPITEPIYYDISTTAGFTSGVEVCVEYNSGNLSTEQLAELTLQVYEATPGQWINITSNHDVGAHIICGSVDHLSEFAVMAPGAAPAIMVLSPNGNEIWPVGSQQEIQWTSTDFTDPVRIEYSIDGNASHLEVISSTENDGSYLWTVPNTPSTLCVVIVSDAADGQPYDISDAVFTISTAAAPTITVLSPNGGENWLAGSEQEIQWSSTDFTDPVRIELSIDAGATYETIVETTENDGSFTLTVPDAPSNSCIVKVSDVDDGEPFDISDAVFTITTGTSGGPIIIVDNTDDSGPGSLRAAIMQANTHAGMDTIIFNIPKGVPGHDPDVGIWTILPTSALPAITDPGLVIDGRSQAEFVGEDSNPNGPEIVLNGSQAGTAAGLAVFADNTEIYALTINRFKSIGIDMYGVEGGRIAECYIGTDFAGVDTAGNYDGIELRNGTKNVTVAGNIISGNKRIGIFLADSSSYNIVHENLVGLNRMGTVPAGNFNEGISIQRNCSHNEIIGNRIGGNTNGIVVYQSDDNIILGNLIGTDETWEPEFGNQGTGVYIWGDAEDNTIAENTIGYNGVYGVGIFGQGSLRNRISHNSISGNSLQGIHLEDGGNVELTPPVIVSVTETEISGTTEAEYTVEVFADDNDQGHFFLGSIQADPDGNYTFVFTEPLPSLPYVTVTATDTAGNTSEFSQPFNVTAVDEQPHPVTPEAFKLGQNYPNPFNPETVIRYELPRKSHVTLRIFNLMGKVVATLVDEEKDVGSHSVIWGSTDDRNRQVVSGVYFYQLKAGNFVKVKKMILLQ